MKEDALNAIREKYEEAVDMYVSAFLRHFGISQAYTWWVGGRKGHDAFFFNDCHSVSIEDMVFILENNVSFDEFLQHEDYCVRCINCGLEPMNIKAWHKGAPKYSEEKLQRIESLRKELNELIEETKKGKDNGFTDS